jgi:hypothetical protein
LYCTSTGVSAPATASKYGFSLNQTYQQKRVWKNFDMIIVWSYCFVKTGSGRKDLIVLANSSCNFKNFGLLLILGNVHTNQ